jgi:fatty acid synthase subunit alpha
MMLPSDELKVNVHMRDGNIIVKIETINDRGEKVLEGSAEVAQPTRPCHAAGQRWLQHDDQ